MGLRDRTIRLASTLPAGSSERRTLLATLRYDKIAADWIQKAIKHPGRVHKLLGIPEKDDIPKAKIEAEIKKLKGKAERTDKEQGDLKALNMALTLKGPKVAGDLMDLPGETGIQFWMPYDALIKKVIGKSVVDIRNAPTDNFITPRTMKDSVDDRVNKMRKEIHGIIDKFGRDAKRQGLL